MRLGIHTSTAGSLEAAAHKAADLGANTFQIFTSSPRMWRAAPPSPAQIGRLKDARQSLDLHPLVVHANYLINLASADPDLRAKSILAFRGELERAIAIGAEFVVLHPGSSRGSEPEQGIAAAAEALVLASKDLPGAEVTVLLENTAGAGSHLGSSFEQLAAIRDQAAACPIAIGYCLDTCHLLAAGFDIATAEGLADTLRHADATLGLDRVHVIHANDSKSPLGSHVDRHQNIGEGCIGDEAFRRILAHPQLRAKPFILETPVANEGDDQRNMNRLKSLAEPQESAVPVRRSVSRRPNPKSAHGAAD